MVDNYPESIQLMAKFTVESLQMWQFAPNSIHYLLSLWQRMVASVPYVKVGIANLNFQCSISYAGMKEGVARSRFLQPDPPYLLTLYKKGLLVSNYIALT